MAEDRVQSWNVKRVKFLDRESVPVLCQNSNGPCPLLAIANILSLRNQLHLTPASTTSVTLDQLINLLAQKVLELGDAQQAQAQGDSSFLANLRQNIDDCLPVLGKLNVGLDVNLRFNSPTAFEATRELTVFDLLGIDLVHGWVVDPEDMEVAAVIGARSFNELQVLLAEADAAASQVRSPAPAASAVPPSFTPQTAAAVSSTAADGEQPLAAAGTQVAAGDGSLIGDLLGAEELVPAGSPVKPPASAPAPQTSDVFLPTDATTQGSVTIAATPKAADAIDLLWAEAPAGSAAAEQAAPDVGGGAGAVEGAVAVEAGEDGAAAQGADSTAHAVSVAAASAAGGDSTQGGVGPSGSDTALNRQQGDQQHQQPELEKQQQQQQQQQQPTEAQVQRAQQLQRDAHVVRAFLDRNCSQLTWAGLEAMSRHLRPNQLAVFFRNDHFNVVFKHEEQLYLLVTDEGYRSWTNVVWERLDRVDGDTRLCGADFQPYVASENAMVAPDAYQELSPEDAAAIAAAATEGLADVETGHGQDAAAAAAASALAAAAAGPQAHGGAAPHAGHQGQHDEDADLALALQLQEEENMAAERLRQQQAQLQQQQQQQQQQAVRGSPVQQQPMQQQQQQQVGGMGLQGQARAPAAGQQVSNQRASQHMFAQAEHARVSQQQQLQQYAMEQQRRQQQVQQQQRGSPQQQQQYAYQQQQQQQAQQYAYQQQRAAQQQRVAQQQQQQQPRVAARHQAPPAEEDSKCVIS